MPPPVHAAEGLKRAVAVEPLDAFGLPDAAGRVVLLSVGMSNATLEFSGFKAIADADPQKNPSLSIVDGAQSGTCPGSVDRVGSLPVGGRNEPARFGRSRLDV